MDIGAPVGPTLTRPCVIDLGRKAMSAAATMPVICVAMSAALIAGKLPGVSLAGRPGPALARFRSRYICLVLRADRTDC